jgi:hypothetical protein
MPSMFPHSIQYNVVNPHNQEPTGFVLELIGMDDDEYVKATAESSKYLRSLGVKSADDLTMEHGMVIQKTVTARCIVGWTNTNKEILAIFKQLGFDDDVYSVDKAQALINHRGSSWIRAQIQKVVGEKESFFA